MELHLFTRALCRKHLLDLQLMDICSQIKMDATAQENNCLRFSKVQISRWSWCGSCWESFYSSWDVTVEASLKINSRKVAFMVHVFNHEMNTHTHTLFETLWLPAAQLPLGRVQLWLPQRATDSPWAAAVSPVLVFNLEASAGLRRWTCRFTFTQLLEVFSCRLKPSLTHHYRCAA